MHQLIDKNVRESISFVLEIPKSRKNLPFDDAIAAEHQNLNQPHEVKSSWGNAANKCYYEDNWYIYALKCQLGNYVGITSNLINRLEQHKNGLVPTTAHMGYISILGSKYVGDYILASKLERLAHRTNNMNFIVNSDNNLPTEAALKLFDSTLESKVRYCREKI